MMFTFKKSDLLNLEKNSSVHLINSLPGLKSLNLIGTKSNDGFENLAIFSSVIHLGSNPPLIGFIHRPKSDFSHTLKNIEATGHYTINSVHQSMILKAHVTAEKNPLEVSEFETSGLQSEYLDGFFAPFVKESRLKYGLKMLEVIPIPANGTFLIVGEVFNIMVDPKLLKENYSIDHILNGTAGVTGVEEYIGIHQPDYSKWMSE